MDRFLPHSILKYQLYILQLEEYDSRRYLRSLFSKGLFPSPNLRKSLVWTNKAKLLALLTTLIILTLDGAICYLLYSFLEISIPALILTFLVLLYLLILISFSFLTQALDIIRPIEYILKKRMISQAKEKLAKYPNLKIVGITGSYGKTTMKETVATILSEKYKVVKTTGNNNTPLGIAKTILNHVNEKTEIFVVEMGEYVKGDVAEICKITPPDYSIITGINEAHLERYQTMAAAISTKFEIIEYAKENVGSILNADDDLIIDHFKDFIKKGNPTYFYSGKDFDKLHKGYKKELKFVYGAKDIEFDEDKGSYTFELLYQNDSIGKIKTQILAPYIIGNITGAATVAKALGMNDTEIRLGISKLKPVEHRLEPRMNNNNILVIDDTYNGNSDGIKIGLELLSKFKKRRKVYVTPGLVETGSLAQALHVQIGRDIAKVADLVILLKNSVTPYIFEGLVDAKFNPKKVIWYDYSKEMYSELHKYLEPNDVVLMQNDWSDNYS